MVVTRTGVHTTSGLLTADFASGSRNRSGGAAEVGFPPTPGRKWPAVPCGLAARHIQSVANGVEMELQPGCLSAFHRTP